MQEANEPEGRRGKDASGTQVVPPDFGLLFSQLPEVLLILLPDAPRYTMVAATDLRLQVTHTTRETLGSGLFEVFPDNPDDAAATGTSNLRASLDRVLATGLPDTMAVQKYDIPGPDGAFTRKFWSPKNVPVLSADGRVSYIIHRVEDVTELVDASEQGVQLQDRNRDMEREVIRRSNELAAALGELRAANSRLAELDAAKTAFFSNISHDFRTPLTLMLAPLEEELTESSLAPDDPRRLRLDAAYRNALRLLKLVNTLLDFARIEAGRASVNFEPTDLAALTAELASSFRSAIERGGLRFTIDCPPLAGTVRVDRDMWEKIVLNLLSNAFKHTFAGEIAVRLMAVGETVRLTVEDSGVGIAPEELPRLFERFHRVQGAASRSHEGSGIGLSLVRELVQLHGGTIQVESRPGEGSRFVVTLQAGNAQPTPAPGEPAAGSATRAVRHAAAYVHEAMHWLPELPAEVSGQYPSLSADRPRVLWADDNADMRHYVTRLLGSEYQVTAVADGQEALDAALADPPDLVLSDVMMPRLDGFGLLRGLRADERTRRLPVILLSARAGEESALEGLDSGADDYLVKPFSARELLARVRAHVTLARERHAWEKLLEDKVRERTAELLDENARRRHTEQRLASQLERMALLDHITRAIGERQDLRSIFQVVVGAVKDSLPVEHCWIGLEGPDTTGLVPHEALVYEPDLRSRPMPLPPGFNAQDIGCCVVVPLRDEQDLIGVLVAGRRDAGAFASGDCEFLRQLGEHVGLAIRQARLHDSLWTAYEDLRQTQQAALQQERLSALGQMASGIAHDINNALSPAVLYLEQLLEADHGLSHRSREVLPVVLRAVEDVAATVARLREFYRPRETQAALLPVDINELVRQTLDLTRVRWCDMPQQRGILIEATGQLAPDLPRVPGAEGELREVLTNLIFNAVDAMPEGGTLRLGTSLLESGVQLEVVDTGTGMDEETRRKCLEPFFTTKGERGTGLGLAMVYGTLKRHGARIDIRSEPGKGTVVSMLFPVSDVTADAGSAMPRAVEPPTGLRLLVIDDDPVLRRTLHEALRKDAHRVTTAPDGPSGIEAFRLACTSFDAVITDLGMPRMDGRAVARAIKEISPAMPVILLTGWGQRPDVGSNPLPCIDRVIAKPPKLRDLRSALAELVLPQAVPRSDHDPLMRNKEA